MSIHNTARRQRGLSLPELIVFIVIVGISVAGILLVMDRTTRASADPLTIKQALAIAESLMDEVQLAPFTYCDPDDAQAATATSAAVGAGGCAATPEAIGAEAGETRYATPVFDNVNDYHNFSMAGIRDITNTVITGLSSYTASVTVAAAAMTASPAGTIAAGSGDALLITVTVTGPQNAQVVLHGYRTRYAPNATP